MRQVGRIECTGPGRKRLLDDDWRSFAEECRHFSRVGRVWCRGSFETPGRAFVTEAEDLVAIITPWGHSNGAIGWLSVSANADWCTKAAGIAREVAKCVGGEFVPVPPRVAEFEALFEEFEDHVLEIRFADRDVAWASDPECFHSSSFGWRVCYGRSRDPAGRERLEGRCCISLDEVVRITPRSERLA